jgi:hypothetical protein
MELDFIVEGARELMMQHCKTGRNEPDVANRLAEPGEPPSAGTMYWDH